LPFHRKNVYFHFIMHNVLFLVNKFEGVTQESWLEMIDAVDMGHPSQDAVASVVSALFRDAAKASGDPGNMPDPWPYDPDWFNR
jgi:hypothetical protein